MAIPFASVPGDASQAQPRHGFDSFSRHDDRRSVGLAGLPVEVLGVVIRCGRSPTPASTRCSCPIRENLLDFPPRLFFLALPFFGVELFLPFPSSTASAWTLVIVEVLAVEVLSCSIMPLMSCPPPGASLPRWGSRLRSAAGAIGFPAAGSRSPAPARPRPGHPRIRWAGAMRFASLAVAASSCRADGGVAGRFW